MRSIADDLAIERTRLANERTLLAYLRTGLAVAAGGIGIAQLFETALFTGVALIVIGGLTVALGVVRFTLVRRRLERVAARPGS